MSCWSLTPAMWLPRGDFEMGLVSADALVATVVGARCKF